MTKANSKTAQIKAAVAAGDYDQALKIGAKFFDDSVETKQFQRAQAAATRPEFYRQLGRDPEQERARAIEMLRQKFGPAGQTPDQAAA